MYFELSSITHKILDILLFPLVEFLVIPLTTIYHTLIYLLDPPFRESKVWPYGHYIKLNNRRVSRAFYTYGRLPLPDNQHWNIPNESRKYMKECEVQQVIVEPFREEEGVPKDILRFGREYVIGVDVPCWWIRSRKGMTRENSLITEVAQPNERVIYFVVGGGYVAGHPLRIHTPWSIARLTGARVFCVNYRKSLSASTAFPASLLDCLAGYQYLIKEKGFESKNIMLCGDSAGANAALALSKYLSELDSPDLDQVGSMCLHSPWVDMTGSFDSLSRNKYTDHLIDLTNVHIPSHTRHYPRSYLTSTYFSPALTPIGGFDHLSISKEGVKVYISAGTAEVFYDEIISLVKGMKRDGVRVQLRELNGATHSDFVSVDKGEWFPRGWSWSILEEDFKDFWNSTA